MEPKLYVPNAWQPTEHGKLAKQNTLHVCMGVTQCLKVNGYHNEIGEYIECRPPLQIDVEDLTHLAGPGGDGLIYAQEIFARVQAAMDARQGAH